MVETLSPMLQATAIGGVLASGGALIVGQRGIAKRLLVAGIVAALAFGFAPMASSLGGVRGWAFGSALAALPFWVAGWRRGALWSFAPAVLVFLVWPTLSREVPLVVAVFGMSLICIAAAAHATWSGLGSHARGHILGSLAMRLIDRVAGVRSGRNRRG